MLIMQGTADDNLTPDMADNFAAAYTKAGGTVIKEIFPGQPHAFIPGAPTAPDSLRALEMIKAFIHKHARLTVYSQALNTASASRRYIGGRRRGFRPASTPRSGSNRTTRCRTRIAAH